MAQQKSLAGVINEEKLRICTDCGSSSIEFENEEMYCGKCGLVLE